MSASIYCPHCHKHTALSVAPTKYEDRHRQEFYASAIWDKEDGQQWWMGICNSCQNPSLVLNRGEVVYPHPLPSPTDHRVPRDLARDLDEAKMCFTTSCFRACAAMARRVVQSACIQRGAQKRDLVDQIKELGQTGVITKEIEEWATVVRWIGNDAAHPNKDDVSKEDADDCLKLAEQFLYIIFVTPAIAKARRAAKGK